MGARLMLDLERASFIAERLLAALAPACDRMQVAGSIRRRKSMVKDIELVAVPRWRLVPVEGVTQSMFQPPQMQRVSLLREAIEREVGDRLMVIKPNTSEIIPWVLKDDSRYVRLYLPKQALKVDLFVCTPETWGMNYMIRTGSGVGPSGIPSDGFAPRMLARWKEVAGAGAHSMESRLYRPAARQPEDTPEERDVFRLCRVAWVPPEERIDAAAVERYAEPLG